MEDRCFTHEELDELLALDPTDPRLAHLEKCSACRTLLASYRAFLDPGDLPESANRDEARRRLDLFRERMIAGDVEAPAGGSPEGSFLSRFLAYLRGPALRPGLAALLLLIAATALWTNRDALRPERRSGILREVPTAGSGDIVVQPPIPREGGGFVFEWSSVDGAESCRVQIIGVEMTPLREFSLVDSNRLEVTGDAIAGLADSGPLFWRVIVYRSGDELARSSLHALPRGPRALP